MWILIGDPTIKLEQPQSQGKCPIWNGTAKEPADLHSDWFRFLPPAWCKNLQAKREVKVFTVSSSPR